MTLARRTAVITGGGRGIGAAVARTLCAAGATVIVAARTERQLASTVAALREAGGTAHAIPVDVTNPESVGALYQRALELLGHVDVLVNNAGIAGSAPIKHETLEQWNRIMAVNATGPFLCARAFLPAMAERGFGRVVNVASITSRMGAPYIAAYTASKHALLGLTRVAAAEYGAKGVTVNAVCPGYVRTEMTDESVARVKEKTGLSDAAALDAILKTAGQKRLIEPEEVAHVVAALCDDAGGGVNGQAIVIDGGGLLA